jgi:hypothetical protein
MTIVALFHALAVHPSMLNVSHKGIALSFQLMAFELRPEIWTAILSSKDAQPVNDGNLSRFDGAKMPAATTSHWRPPAPNRSHEGRAAAAPTQPHKRALTWHFHTPSVRSTPGRPSVIHFEMKCRISNALLARCEDRLCTRYGSKRALRSGATLPALSQADYARKKQLLEPATRAFDAGAGQDAEARRDRKIQEAARQDRAINRRARSFSQRPGLLMG